MLRHRIQKAGEAHREDSSYRGRRRLAQWAVYDIEWASRTERTPATEGENSAPKMTPKWSPKWTQQRHKKGAR